MKKREQIEFVGSCPISSNLAGALLLYDARDLSMWRQGHRFY
ncbi:hypothetical protein Q7C30_007405 [Pseudomonas sp. RAC1]|nr:hypothetical protein [Pseudomonas sp. RAC1]MDV9031919.1 hypothetical protein [Pseudomonas sp. RAC1]